MKHHKYLITAALVLFSTGIVLLALELHKNVELIVDGESQTISTWAWNVSKLLEQQDIELSPNDQLDPLPETWLREGSQITINKAFLVALQVQDEIQTVYTTEQLPGNILMDAGVTIYPGDRVLVNGESTELDQVLPQSYTHLIQVLRGVEITLNSPSGVQKFFSTAPTLGKALWENKIWIREGDLLNPAFDTPLQEDLTVEHIPAKALTILEGSQEHKIYTAAATVGQALAEGGFSLQGLDYSIPKAEAKIPSNRKIQLIRVQEEVLLNQEPLPFEVEYQASAELEIDSQRILETGAYGVQAEQVRLRYENGEEVDREVESEWLAREPTTRIIGYGTKISKKTLEVPGGSIEYWRAVPMYATSYSPCRLGVPNYCNDVTASGLKLQKGVAGVAKSWYNATVGLQVYVPGYGTATIADFGNGLPGKNLIDLGFSEDDFEPWHQDVTVYFLWPPPPPEQIMWMLPY